MKFKSTFLFPGLKNAGSFYGITYDEFLDFYDLLHKIIAEYLGAEYSQEVVDDGIIVSIRKK